MMRTTLILLALAAGAGLFLLALHHLVNALVRWGRRAPRTRQTWGGTTGNAFLEIQGILEAGKRHQVEMRKEHREEEDEAGGPAS